MRRLLVVLACVAAFAAMPVAAASQVALTGGVPTRFAGNVEARATAGWLLTEEAPSAFGIQGSVAMNLHTVHAEYVRVGDALVRLTETATSVPIPIAPSELRIESTGPHFLLVASAGDAHLRSARVAPAHEDAWSDANVQTRLMMAPRSSAPARPLAGGLPSPLAAGFPSVPEGIYETRFSPATVEAGVGRVVIQDATVAADGLRWAGTSSFVPAANAVESRFTETLSWIVLEGPDLRLRFEAGSATLASKDLRLQVDGLAVFPWATGRLEDAPGVRRFHDEQLTLGGRFVLSALGVDGGPTASVAWLGQGDFGFVHVNGPAPASPVPAGALVATAVVATAGLGLAAYFAPYLKWASTALLMPLYARLPRDRILEHEGREGVYELVKAEPGVSTHQLASRVDFSWSTLTYHLRVLERNGKISAVRDGRYKRFFDRENPAYANGRKGVVAVLRNEATREIGRAVLVSPGVSQKDLTLRFGLSPSSIHWHVERLVAAGLLEKRRDGHHVRHYPASAWHEVPAQELGLQAEYAAAFGGAGPALAVPVAPTREDPATV